MEIIGTRKNELQQRVDKIRSRLEFKNAHDDYRFKEHIKKKLDDVRDCEEVDLMIEVPKIFKGSTARHTDGALYLKNISSQQQAANNFTQDSNTRSRNSTQNKEKDDSQNKNKKVDRFTFYSKFGKDIKEMRAVEYQDQKILFKKSSFD